MSTTTTTGTKKKKKRGREAVGALRNRGVAPNEIYEVRSKHTVARGNAG